MKSFRAFAIVGACVALTACAKWGYSDRVLWRVVSPDGRMVAVCQEIPQFDGPSFALRLERPDGTLLRRLYEIGDGDPCSEITWAQDGRTLAVLSAHVARLRFVDVAWLLDNPDIEPAHWSWRQVSFAGEREFVLGRNVRFTKSMTVELELCPYRLDVAPRGGKPSCDLPPVTRVLEIPQPIVTGHRVASARRPS